jgi:hypothetical protein
MAVAREQATCAEYTLDPGLGISLHTRHVEVRQWGSRMERRHRDRALGAVHAIDHEGAPSSVLASTSTATTRP